MTGTHQMLYRGGGDIAYVTSVATHDGQVICTCISEMDGQVWEACPVAAFGGAEGAVRFPVTVPAGTPGVDTPLDSYPRAYIGYRSSGLPPVVLGIVSHGVPGDVVPADSRDTADTPPPDPTHRDVSLRVGGSSILIQASSGDIRIAPQGNVTIVLDDSNVVEVQQGADSSGRLALVSATADALSALKNAIDEISAWLSTVVVVAPSGGGTCVITPPFQAPSVVLPDGTQLSASAFRLPDTSDAEVGA